MMDPEINTDDFLLEGLELALGTDSAPADQALDPLRRIERVYEGVKGAFFLWLIVASILVILS